MKKDNIDYLEKEMGLVHDAFKTMDKFNPDLADAIVSLRKIALSGTRQDSQKFLPQKYRELIMVAVEVATGRGEQGRTHAQKAIRTGASLGEVFDVLTICLYLVGMSSWVDGGYASMQSALGEMRKIKRGEKFTWGSSNTKKMRRGN